MATWGSRDIVRNSFLGQTAGMQTLSFRLRPPLHVWPERWAPAVRTGRRARGVLAATALEFTSARPSDNYPAVEFEISKSCYSCEVNSVDPDRGHRHSICVEVRPENITNTNVPEIPGAANPNLRGTYHSTIKVFDKSTRSLPARNEVLVK